MSKATFACLDCEEFAYVKALTLGNLAHTNNAMWVHCMECSPKLNKNFLHVDSIAS